MSDDTDNLDNRMPGDEPGRVRNPWEKAFLAVLSTTGNIAAATRAAGVNRTTPYAARKRDPLFAADWDEALETACDWLELEARRRAYEGAIRKKFTAQGQPVIDPETGAQYFERDFSDMLLIALLKAHRSAKFRDNASVELTGKDGGPVEQVIIFLPDNGRDQTPAKTD